MRLSIFLACAAGLATLAPAQAKVRIDVDLDAQTMHVEGKDGSYDWKVSSGKSGYETPAGRFKVLWMDKEHHSDTYDNAYMPNAIFFAPGYAIHGFGKSPWGHKASHGCIRIPAAKAAMLFEMVKAEGAEINVTGDSPVEAPTVASVERRNREASAAAPGDDGFVAPGRVRGEQGYDDRGDRQRGYAPAYQPAQSTAGYEAYPSAQPYEAYRQAPAAQPRQDGFFGGLY